jgi:hypothetical protein
MKKMMKTGWLLLLVTGLVLFGACPTGTIVVHDATVRDAAVQKGALDAKIAEAEAAMIGVKAGASADEFLTVQKWVTQSAYDTLNNAITAAKNVSGNSAATQSEVTNALAALTAALNNFSPKQGLKLPDKTALNAKIAEATAAMAGIKISTNGQDVPIGEKWVTQAEYNALNDILTSAKNVSIKSTATRARVRNGV